MIDRKNDPTKIIADKRCHKCDSCGKAFSDAGILNRHINAVHYGKKDHKCDICGKAFSQVGNLNQHMRAFMGGCNKNFYCDLWW